MAPGPPSMARSSSSSTTPTPIGSSTTPPPSRRWGCPSHIFRRMTRLTLDVNGAFQARAGGLARADLDALAPRARAAHAGFERLRAEGKVGFADLPADQEA